MSARPSLGLTIGSLFSGIGGLELGLEWAGVGHTAWQVEQNAYCRAVLATHWPDAVRYDDVCTVGSHNLAPVDVLCGGFPCQDISYAGKGAGLAGARSGLWYEYARIVRELGPRYVVVENVAALLDRGLGDVLGTLASLGYDAEWECVPASAVGAPHIRDRVFLLGYRTAAALAWAGGERRILADAAGRGQRTDRDDADGPAQREVVPDLERGGATVADAPRRRRGEERPHGRGGAEGSRAEGTVGRRPLLGGARVSDTDGLGAQVPAWGRLATEPLPRRDDAPRGTRDGATQWATEPDVGRVADGVPARVDRLRALGNAVVPQVAEVVGRLIVQREYALASEAA